MTGEWNRALRTAQRVLQGRIAALPRRESGQPGNMVDDPKVAGLREAVVEIAALIEPEDD